MRTRRLAGGSLAQVKMVARGLREQLELTGDLLTRGLTAIQELETRLAARRQPLHATMATVSQTLEGAGHRLKKTLRSRVDSLLDRHSGRVGKDLSEFIRNFTPDWDQLAPPSVTPAFRPVLYQLFQEFAKALAHHVTAEVNIALVEFIREQEEWLRQELARLWQPLFLTLQEALALYYREIADLGLAAAAPTLEAAAVARPQGLEVPLLNLEVAPDWRFAREVWVASGLGVLGRAWDAIKRRLKLAGEVDPRRQLLRDLERALAALKDLAGLRTGRPTPQLPGGPEIPVLLPPGGPVAEAAGSQPGRHPRVSPGEPPGRGGGHAPGGGGARRAPPAAGATDPRGPPHRGAAGGGEPRLGLGDLGVSPAPCNHRAAPLSPSLP